MEKIVIEIETTGKHCGECHLRESNLGRMYCNAFGGELEFEDNKDYKRLAACIAATMKKEG